MGELAEVHNVTEAKVPTQIVKTPMPAVEKPEPPKPAKKISKLKAVDPKAAEPQKPKILIFGKPGVGKTWTSLDFPNVYYIDSEGGATRNHYTDKLSKAGGVYFGPEQGSMDFETILGQVQALATEDHEYKTLVIDSITKVFNVEIAKEAERLGDKDAFGASKKPAIAYMRRLINWLSRIDMNVILIAHEKAMWEGGEQNGFTYDAWDKLEYELDLCLNIVRAADKRIAKVRKSRLIGFPDGSTFPWAYQDFADRYGKEVIEKQGGKIVLASPEQIKSVNDLLEVVKLQEGTKEKWFTAAGVTSFEEMDGEKIQKIINLLKERMPK